MTDLGVMTDAGARTDTEIMTDTDRHRTMMADAGTIKTDAGRKWRMPGSSGRFWHDGNIIRGDDDRYRVDFETRWGGDDSCRSDDDRRRSDGEDPGRS